jgi:hypothetical protein
MIQTKIYKNKTIIMLLFMALLFAFYACEESNDTTAAADTEPSAAIGFSVTAAELVEGDSRVEMKILASKYLFNDVSFDLEILDGDASKISTSDANGNLTSTFTILNGAKETSVYFSSKDDSKYIGDYILKYKLNKLVGKAAFIAEKNIGTTTRKVYSEFTLTVKENDKRPPLISFEKAAGTVDEFDTTPHKVKLLISEPAKAAGTFNLVVSGTAASGVDYSSAEVGGVIPVTYKAGDKEIVVNLTSIDNVLLGQINKTVILTIGDLGDDLFAGAIPKYTLTILDNDIPKQVITIVAEADAWIRGQAGTTSAGQNGGAATDVLVSYNPISADNIRQNFFRFDLTGIDPAKIMEAKLVLTSKREVDWGPAETAVGGVTTQDLYYVTNDSWGELTVTANNQPASGTTPIASFTSNFLISTSGLTSIQHPFDVTNQLKVETDGKLSLKLATKSNTASNRIYYLSREVAAYAPKLVITQRL